MGVDSGGGAGSMRAQLGSKTLQLHISMIPCLISQRKTSPGKEVESSQHSTPQLCPGPDRGRGGGWGGGDSFPEETGYYSTRSLGLDQGKKAGVTSGACGPERGPGVVQWQVHGQGWVLRGGFHNDIGQ